MTFWARARSARLAWSLWALCVMLIASSLLLDILTPDFLVPPERPSLILAVSTALLSLACPTVGAVVVSRLPANPTGWIFCGIGVLYGVRRFAVAYADHALLYRPWLPGGEFAAWISTWLDFSGLVALGVFLVLLFPNGRLPSRRWQVVAWVAVFGAAMIGLGEALRFGPLPGYYYVRNPLGVADATGGWLPAYWLLEASGFVGGVLLSVSCLAAIVSMILRLRRARRDERQQIMWFACAAFPAIVGAAVILVDRTIEEFSLLTMERAVHPALQMAANFELFVREDRTLSPLTELRLETTFELLAALVLFIVPVFTGVAILRHRLYDIDVVINRTLVYGTLTAAVVTFYVLLVAVFGALLRIGTEGNLAISLLATGLVAVLFHPLRERLQRGVNRLMYGERQDPYAALSRLGRRLEATLEPGVVLPTIVETVAGALKIPYAAIALKEGDGFTTAATYGSPEGEPTVLPLVRQDEMVGRLILSPRTPNEPFSPDDRRLLEDLARQAGAAVHAVRLTADLQRSRERLITAREEERRRLRRDLHDGLGPTLAGLALGLDVARKLTDREPEEAGGLLFRLEEQTKEAVADIRRLVYGLRPPALDDLGLVAAIRQQAEAFGFVEIQEGEQRDGPGPLFSLKAPKELPHLPAAVEVATYRIAQEALTNVAHHARARSCRVRLAIDEGVLDLVVEDDGVGVQRNRSAGVGLSSMSERAEELGGTCVVEAVPTGGTRVLARIPLPAWESDDKEAT
jgi:signal transduction histidine kinase